MTLPQTPSNGGEQAGGASARFQTLSRLLAENVLRSFGRWISFIALPPPARFLVPATPAVAAGIATLGLVVAVMSAADIAVTAWTRNLPQGIRDVFEQITNLGLSGWFLIPLGALLLAVAALISPALSRISQAVLASLAARFGFLFLAIGVPGLFVTIVKRLIGRARPFVGGHDDAFSYMPFIWRSDYAAMPSGHSTTAVAAAIAIGALWPRTRWVMWIYAITIMASRVIVFAHHASDVIAGALTGAVGAFLLRRWFMGRGLLFCPRDLRPFAGPSWLRIDRAVREAIAAIRASA